MNWSCWHHSWTYPSDWSTIWPDGHATMTARPKYVPLLRHTTHAQILPITISLALTTTDLWQKLVCYFQYHSNNLLQLPWEWTPAVCVFDFMKMKSSHNTIKWDLLCFCHHYWYCSHWHCCSETHRHVFLSLYWSLVCWLWLLSQCCYILHLNCHYFCFIRVIGIFLFCFSLLSLLAISFFILYVVL